MFSNVCRIIILTGIKLQAPGVIIIIINSFIITTCTLLYLYDMYNMFMLLHIICVHNVRKPV